jgi:peptidoglycan/LPS O-acetylase OafA/YrhL
MFEVLMIITSLSLLCNQTLRSSVDHYFSWITGGPYEHNLQVFELSASHLLAPFLLVFTVEISPTLQGILETHILAFMGKISFSFYLLHSMFLPLSHIAIAFANRYTSHAIGPNLAQIMVLFLFYIPFSMFMSFLYWKYVEKRCLAIIEMICI